MEWGTLDLIGIALLLAGAIDDLRSRRIHNSLVLTALIAAFLSVYLIPSSHVGIAPWWSPLLSFGLAFLLALPLFGLKVWGGGDAKLFLAVSPLLLWSEIPIFLLMSLAWGVALGLIRALLSGKVHQMLVNLGQVILHRQPVSDKNLTKIPFSIALLFGFIAVLTLRHQGGAL